tara:strand:- start:186 stop:959 length:774 start_codon:yes stop_codon:yes gene_type:complete
LNLGAHQREVRRVRNDARKAEDEARKAELEKRKQEAAAEELKRVPYEEEMELCEYLSNYLETTYGKNVNHDFQTNSNETDLSLAGKFEGLVLSGKNAGRDHEDDYLSLNKTTGKKKGRGKKKGGLKINEKIMLVPETIEMFALLEVEPPSTINGVSDTVKKLQEKKAWFCTLPRGMVSSLRDKQRADEAKQKSSRRDHGEFNEKSSAPTSKIPVRGIEKVKGFNAADLSAVDDAFPSLPGAHPKKDNGTAQQTKKSD